MAWQNRDGGSYYYRSVRLNGRVRCWYFGRGPAAEVAAVEVVLFQLERLVARERRRAALAPQQAADAALDRLCEMTSVLARAALLAAGYHRHDRGAWRRRREKHTPTG